ncbi:hypothetical protein F6455_10455 [Proteobacteria bacterium 005FR1]|nr:hypothetical protein [Proteobacteria bacterium 005FR1]
MRTKRESSREQQPRNQFHARLLSQVEVAGKERVYAERVIGSTPLDAELPPIEFFTSEEDSEKSW